MSFNIHGMFFDVNDIDIQTDKAGAYKINELLKIYEVTPVSFSSTDIIRSHFGRFEINGISIEVMGDIQKMNNGDWEEIINLQPLIQWQTYKDMRLPVLDIRYEEMAYRVLGRYERAETLKTFINNSLTV